MMGTLCCRKCSRNWESEKKDSGRRKI